MPSTIILWYIIIGICNSHHSEIIEVLIILSDTISSADGQGLFAQDQGMQLFVIVYENQRAASVNAEEVFKALYI